MDIIKRLQLNKNPKDIKSGSIIGAKNLMLDPISSSITTEYGFKEAFDTSNITNHPELQGYEIKGCIPCNEEIVIFLHKNADVKNRIKEDSKIIRLSDDGNVTIVESNWSWEGGKVIGTYAYNYKKELIVAISEIDTDKNIPLKIWNLNTCSSEDNTIYKLEENIPTFKANYAIDENGNLVCGTYTYFIRFVISEDNYTKWFQLTDDIIIINPEEKEKPVHHYANNHTVITDNYNNLFVNNNSIQSNRRIILNLSINSNIFNNFQIGYIIKRDNEILGRLFGEFPITTTNIAMFDNYFLEEVNVNDFLEEPHQFFNVKNLINYNNRLYISNYKEYENDDYSKIIEKLALKCKVIETSNSDNSIKYKLGLAITGGQENVQTVLMSDSPIGNLDNTETINLLTNIGVINYILALSNSAENLLSIGLTNHYYNQTFTPENTAHYRLDVSEALIIDKTNNNKKILLFSKRYEDILYHYQPDKSYIYTLRNNSNITIEQDPNSLLITLVSGNTRIALNDALINVIFYTQSYNDGTRTYPYFCGWASDIDSLGLYGVNYYNPNIYYFSLQQSIIHDKIKNIGGLYNNNRTLIPGQVYNFYIHFIRRDLSVTNGYRLDNNVQTDNFEIDIPDDSVNFSKYSIDNKNYFRCPCLKNINTSKDYLFVPDCELLSKDLEDNNFIGYFISYEKLDICSQSVIPVETKDANDNKFLVTNSDMLYDNKTISGQKIYRAVTTDTNNIDNTKNNITDKQIYTLPYREKNVEIQVELPLDDVIESYALANDKYIIVTDNNNIYNNKIKTLYQLTPFIFNKGETYSRNDLNSAYMFLPGFYNYQKVIHLGNELIFDALSTYIYNKDGTKKNSNYNIYVYSYKHYSENPANAYSIKQDYEKGAVTIDTNVYTNSVLSPSKISDFLELKESYKINPLKTYTNYNKNNQDEFNKTIYRSDVISDESLNNGFRHFNIENYKNILENKGDIVNIVGVGLYLLVHTEYSLFVFDRNNQLSDNAQLQIPDAFDIDYKELTPSDEGFGGLKYKDESILTKNGYIWFDRVSKSIFMFTGQDIKPLSTDIHRLLKNYFETENNYQIRFAEDYYSNRLIITIRDASSYITLSYSFDSNTFISAHDYTFDKNYKTYNNSYIFSEKHPTKLFVYDKKSVDYKDLDIGRRSILTKLVTTGTTQLNSYIDIIFTDKYELPKVLNSISYVMSRNNKYEPYTNIIDQYFNTNYDREPHQNKEKLYSGYQIAIATDLTFSGTLSLDKTAEVNSLNNYRRPHWNQGIWNFNWFRENLPKNVTEGELEQQNVNNQMKEVYEQHDDLYPLSGLEKSDMRSAIIGKYFILRFIFERKQEDLNLKFETVDVNISKL